jgi:hypothetical protein
MHDPELDHLYLAIGEPSVICARHQEARGLAAIPTEPAARTLRIHPGRRRADYAFLPANHGAAIYPDR